MTRGVHVAPASRLNVVKMPVSAIGSLGPWSTSRNAPKFDETKMLFWFVLLMARAVSLWLPGNFEALNRPSKAIERSNSTRGSSRCNSARWKSAVGSESRAVRTIEAADRRSTLFRNIGAPRAEGRADGGDPRRLRRCALSRLLRIRRMRPYSLDGPRRGHKECGPFHTRAGPAVCCRAARRAAIIGAAPTPAPCRAGGQDVFSGEKQH